MVLKGITLTCGCIFFIVCILPLWWMLDILFVLTSPLWYPIIIWWSPKKASEIVNVREKPDESNWFEEACSKTGHPFQNWCNTVLMKRMWQPVVNRLPMRYRDYFIFTGSKPFEEYPVQIQLEYWNYERDELVRTQLLCDGIKKNGVKHRLSDEALLTLWAQDSEARRLWVCGGKEASQKQFNELLKSKPEWLKDHLLAKTPNNVVWGWLIEAAESTTELGSLLESESSIAYAFNLVKELAEQAIPKLEVLYKIFAKETVISEAVAEILDKKSDERATELSIKSRFTAATPDFEQSKLEKTRREAGEKEVQRWTDFCKVKKEIDAEAQNKMCAWQYFIFSETGHHLAIPVLQKALYTFNYKGWVKELMRNEWNNIENPLILPLIKADNDLYNIYLELKVEK